MKDWNSDQYTKFEKERTQPSIDLIRRIHISPKSVLDIGCGPGNSTHQLSANFPAADILGIDSSDNMLEKAESTHPHLRFQKCVIPDGLNALGRFDLIFSNACLHWIPEHRKLLPMLMKQLHSGGMLAVQIPLVQNAVFYKLLGELIAGEPWKKLKRLQIFHSLPPNETYDILSAISKDVTMWETTYYHVVPSHSAVMDWYKGSGLRPYLDALEQTERAAFSEALLKRLQDSMPVQADGSVLLKMPRLFFTAVK